MSIHFGDGPEIRPEQSRYRCLLWTAAAFLLFVSAASFQSHNILRRLCEPEIQSTEAERGVCTLNDFRDAIYFPVVAFLDRKNPYDAVDFMASYPVGDVFPPYLPMTLILHLPFGLADFRHAATGYLLLTLLLTILLAWLCLKLADLPARWCWVFALGTLFLLSRPGQRNLSLGECTVTVGVGVAMALLYIQKPVLGGIGLGLACYKPTYGIPLVLLFLAQGYFLTAFAGVCVAGILSLCAVYFLVVHSGGLQPFLESLFKGHAWAEERWVSSPATSPGRIDLKGVLGRLLQIDPGIMAEIILFMLLVGAGAWILRSGVCAGREGRLSAREIALLVLLCLTCLFHQEYDLIMLFLPLPAFWKMAAESSSRSERRFAHWVVFLLAVPLFNYLQSVTIQNRLGIIPGSLSWRMAASINGVFLFAALILLFRSGMTLKALSCPNSRPAS